MHGTSAGDRELGDFDGGLNLVVWPEGFLGVCDGLRVFTTVPRYRWGVIGACLTSDVWMCALGICVKVCGVWYLRYVLF